MTDATQCLIAGPLGRTIRLEGPAAVIAHCTSDFRTTTTGSPQHAITVELCDPEARVADTLARHTFTLRSNQLGSARSVWSDGDGVILQIHHDRNTASIGTPGHAVVWARGAYDAWLTVRSEVSGLWHRLYREVPALVVHAAVTDAPGGRVMFIGSKGAGKTTNALVASSLGAPILGDEAAAVYASGEALRIAGVFRQPAVHPRILSAYGIDAPPSARRIGDKVVLDLPNSDVDGGGQLARIVLPHYSPGEPPLARPATASHLERVVRANLFGPATGPAVGIYRRILATPAVALSVGDDPAANISVLRTVLDLEVAA